MRPHRASQLLMVVVITATLSACTGFPPRRTPTVEFVPAGPGALVHWNWNRRYVHRRRPSVQEHAAFEAALRDKIRDYVAQRPSLSTSVRRGLTDLKVVPAMTADEVRLLLGEPLERGTDSALLMRHAWHRWSDLRNRVDEVWVYRLYYNDEQYSTYALYFRDGIVDTIINYSWGAL